MTICNRGMLCDSYLDFSSTYLGGWDNEDLMPIFACFLFVTEAMTISIYRLRDGLGKPSDT